jgi:hypothetical protein
MIGGQLDGGCCRALGVHAAFSAIAAFPGACATVASYTGSADASVSSASAIASPRE